LYSILTEFGIPIKLVMLIKMCLDETYSKVRIGKNVPTQNGLKQGEVSSLLLLNFVLEYALGTSNKIRKKWNTSATGLC